MANLSSFEEGDVEEVGEDGEVEKVEVESGDGEGKEMWDGELSGEGREGEEEEEECMLTAST